MTPLPVSQNKDLFEEWRQTLSNEIVHSPCTPIEVPTESLVSRTLRKLKQNAERCPEKAVVIDGYNQTRFLTSQQLHDQALSVAAFLQSRGYGNGQRAITMLPSCIELPVIHLGIWAAGGTFIGARPALKNFETVYQLSDSASSVVFTCESALKMILTAAEECPAVKTIICIRSSDNALPEGVIDFRAVLAFSPMKDAVPVSMNAPCVIIYSSGTTGLSKGVIHTHRTYHSNIEILKSHFEREVYPVIGFNNVDWLQEYQIIATAATHMLGFGMLNWWLLTGSTIVLLDRLDDELYPQVLEQFRPRYLFVTPPIFAYLSKHPLGVTARLDSVKLVLCSSAPLSKEVGDEFFSHHPSVKYIVQGYGMTETGYSHLPLLLKQGTNASSGVIVSNNQQKIVVPGSNKSCKLGEWGEICVKGPGVTVGYLNKPEANEYLFDEEGWLHSGDIGYLDEFGCLCVVDRLKELIKVNYLRQNIQMSPAEVEGILLSHRRVRDVAIVGVPHEDGGELVRAFVVKSDQALSAAEVEQLVAAKLAPYKQITGGVVFLEAIPRSATGKILRRELRALDGSQSA